MNRQWLLARAPAGALPEPEDFALREQPLPDPGPGQALTRTIYLSLDPYQWGRRRGGVEKPGEVCHGRTVSQVAKSRSDALREGDYFFNTNGWQQYGLSGDGVAVFGYMFPRRLDPAAAPISTALGVLGMLGLTAYAGMIVQCAPQVGETAVVSAASGGVGQCAAQLARIRGCRVVGIAGSPEKCAFVRDELGLDACVSHRSPHFAEELAAACRGRVDVYFENVGGKVFDAVLPLFARGARMSLCGVITQWSASGPTDSREALLARGRTLFEQRGVQVHPLSVANFVASHQAQFLDEMGAWVRAGKIHYKEDLREGLEQAPAVFRELLEGRTFGKTLIGVGEDPSLDDATRRRRAGANVLAS
jgi:NADPH-dependent curcumin reductase CurA